MDINVLIKLDESKRELIELIPTSPKRIYNIQLPHITEYSKIIDNMYVKIIYMNKYKSDQLVFSYNYIEHINATKYWKTKQELVRIFIPRFDIQDSDGKQTEKVFNILVYIIYLLIKMTLQLKVFYQKHFLKQPNNLLELHILIYLANQ